MQSRIDLYVNKENKPVFDQLKAISDIDNNLSFSSLLGIAASDYLKKLNNEPDLISNEKEWNIILKNSTAEQLIKYNTLICKLNQKIAKRLCHT